MLVAGLVSVAACSAAVLAGSSYAATGGSRAPTSNARLSAVSGPRESGAPRLETGTSKARHFYGARRPVTFYYRVTHDRPVKVTIRLVRALSGKTMKTWRRTAEPGPRRPVGGGITQQVGLAVGLVEESLVLRLLDGVARQQMDVLDLALLSTAVDPVERLEVVSGLVGHRLVDGDACPVEGESGSCGGRIPQEQHRGLVALESPDGLAAFLCRRHAPVDPRDPKLPVSIRDPVEAGAVESAHR
jgi:hypothetical protein